jgi:FtsH-binding integral membrane protein
MPRKLRITLWVTIGLIIAAILWIIIMNLVAPIIPMATHLIFFALIFVCGILIVHWTRKNITQKPLKRYLLLAGASAMGILFFGVPVHMLTEAGFVLSLFVCPITLIVGAVMALRFKSTPAS